MGAPLFGREHVDRYRETDGEEGHGWQGTTVLLLTTTGRNSGAERTTPLIYQRHGDDYLVVASNARDSSAAAAGWASTWLPGLRPSPIQTIDVHADDPDDLGVSYFVVNAGILGLGIGLNALGARLRARRWARAHGVST